MLFVPSRTQVDGHLTPDSQPAPVDDTYFPGPDLNGVRPPQDPRQLMKDFEDITGISEC